MLILTATSSALTPAASACYKQATLVWLSFTPFCYHDYGSSHTGQAEGQRGVIPPVHYVVPQLRAGTLTCVHL